MTSRSKVVAAQRLTAATVFLAFAAFGLLWGLYAAALPMIKSRTGTSDGALGTALVCVGLAAAPAMFVVGRLLDRFGRTTAVAAVISFAVVAPLPTFATNLATLVASLLLFGAGSGACDVVINSLAATVEAESGSRVLNRAHALFSLGLLVGSVVTAVSRASGLSASWPLLVFSLLTIASALALHNRVPVRLMRPAANGDQEKPTRTVNWLVIGFGSIAALAALVESGVQQWSAVFLQDVVGSPGLSSLAPGIFAGSMALGRLGGHALTTKVSDRITLFCSGVVATLGVVVTATAQFPFTALLGFAVTGAAISVAAPTIYGIAGRVASPQHRGAVIGTTASIAYIGLLLGPAVVGQLASLTSLRTAIAALSITSLAVAVTGVLIRVREGSDLTPDASGRGR